MLAGKRIFMKIHLLSGFLGSGKTTAIQTACGILSEQGVSTAVISNDQGIRLVDGDLFRHLGIPGRQVMNGCFCCNYGDLDRQIQSLQDAVTPGQIFAESVGSCTDIIATVLKPLRRFRQDAVVTLSVFADAMLLHMLLVKGDELFDETVRYIYFKQLEEAAILIVNKADLLNPDQLQALREALGNRFPDKVLHIQDARDPRQVAKWLALCDRLSPDLVPESLELDYQIYGEGEAKLAWLDQEIAIESAANKANHAAGRLMLDIHRRIAGARYPVGHLKFLLNGREKFSFTSTTAAELISVAEPAASATLLLNARVQTVPEMLCRLVALAIAELENEGGLKIMNKSVSSFQPGFPTPVHRMI
jgi:Ni2+-binding GTPase involved in maturation of urease and hydrogenase